MDVSGVGHANHVHGPLAAVTTQQQQQVSVPPAQDGPEEDSVELSPDAKVLAAQSHEGE